MIISTQYNIVVNINKFYWRMYGIEHFLTRPVIFERKCDSVRQKERCCGSSAVDNVALLSTSLDTLRNCVSQYGSKTYFNGETRVRLMEWKIRCTHHSSCDCFTLFSTGCSKTSIYYGTVDQKLTSKHFFFCWT